MSKGVERILWLMLWSVMLLYFSFCIRQRASMYQIDLLELFGFFFCCAMWGWTMSLFFKDRNSKNK